MLLSDELNADFALFPGRYTPVSRTELFDEILMTIYRTQWVSRVVFRPSRCLSKFSSSFPSLLAPQQQQPNLSTRRNENFQSHHALALLFSIFALASHFDPQKENYSIEAREYYQLARTTLGFESPVRQTTLAAIQTLV
jgi:hypothetical protein